MKWGSTPRKHLFKFVFFYTIVLTLIVLVFALAYQDEIENDRRNLIHQQVKQIENQEKYILNTVSAIETDLRLAMSHGALRNYIESKSIEDYSELSEELLAFSINSSQYDQVRLLNLQGAEVLRINYLNGGPHIVPQDELQQKTSRYYFKRMVDLDLREVYTSPIDLNVERGEIELPYKPTIRMGAVVTGVDHERQGVFILNYEAEEMLSGLDDFDIVGNTMLVDNLGYWLKADDESKLWSAMVPERALHRFEVEYLEEWEIMQQAPEGQIQSKHGIFTYQRIYPASKVNGSWFLISHVSNEELAMMQRTVFNRLLILGLVTSGIWILAGFLSFRAVKNGMSGVSEMNS